ncbi:hypothetical protein BZG36_00689 [Bifiguratus adelaidae]|uniref:Fanconi anemia group D2 protein n=1 Tax=Bifiguratus adelaidae TaxID=1938954 RepID=A0A261Y6T0_9FUNG|nr:hypothetical protein BZG36_00689 [Bifiguratus adelaidae]
MVGIAGTNPELDNTSKAWLEQAGIVFEEHSSIPIALSTDHAVVRWGLSKGFREVQGSLSRQAFLDFLRALLNQAGLLHSWVRPLPDGSKTREQSTSLGNPSLLRLLLHVDTLQTQLVDLILEKVAVEASMCGQLEGLSRSLIHQLRWLDHIVDPLQLSDKLIEVINAVPIEAKRDLITVLPEVLNDTAHEDIIQLLKSFLDDNQDLTRSILDCLGNFVLSDDVLQDLLQMMIDRLESAEVKDLPVIVSFLIRDVQPGAAESMIQSIRKAINVEALMGSLRSQGDQTSAARIDSQLIGQPKSNEGMSDVAVLLDTIRTSLQLRKSIADVWLKELKQVIQPTESHLGDQVDDVMIFIRKQLASPSVDQQRIGVLGILSMVERFENAPIEISGSQSSSRGPNAALSQKLLTMTVQTCERSPTALSFLYDQLAQSIVHGRFEQTTISWINDKIASRFPDVYLDDKQDVEQYLAEQNDTTHKMQIWMNLDDERSTVVLKIYPYLCPDDPPISEDDPTAYSPAGVLPQAPLFRLMATCERVTNGDSLKDIDALLGCGILLIEPFSDKEAAKFAHEGAAGVAICDSIFFAIDWLREVINAFAKETDGEMAVKVVQRLRNIRELEASLDQMLVYRKSYVPPMVPEGTEGGKSASSTLTVTSRERTEGNTTAHSDDEAPGHEHSKKRGKHPNGMDKVSMRRCMRELELYVIQIIQYEYMQWPDTGSLSFQETKDKLKLQPADLLYLLHDFRLKVESKLGKNGRRSLSGNRSSRKTELSMGFSLLDGIEIATFVQSVIDFLPGLLRRLELLQEELLSEAEEGPIEEEVLLSQDLDDIKLIILQGAIILECYRCILISVKTLVTWVTGRQGEYPKLAKDMLQAIHARVDPMRSRAQLPPKSQMVKNCIKYIGAFSAKAPNGAICAQLYEIVAELQQWDPSDLSLSSTLGELADAFLQTDWKDSREIKVRSSKYSIAELGLPVLQDETLLFMLEEQLSHNAGPVARIQDYINHALPMLETGDTDVLEQNPFLTTTTCPTFYKAMHVELNKQLRNLNLASQDVAEAMHDTQQMVDCWHNITLFVKENDKKAFLAIVLKQGREFVEVFTKKVLPFLGLYLKSHKDSIADIFKPFQQATRYLQAICGHVKISKDVSLTVHVPPLKKALENVIYQVKAMLSDHRLPPEAFFLGALKHRDIKYNEVSSQLPPESSSESQADSEAEDAISDPSSDEIPQLQETTSSSKRTRPVKNNRRTRSRVDVETAVVSAELVASSDMEDDE